jgi:subtilisin family serine protease
MRNVWPLVAFGAVVLAVPAAAQLALPPVNLPPVELPEAPLDRTLGRVGETAGDAASLLEQRTERIERLVRRNRDLIERDAEGAPARRGELLLIEPSSATLAAATAAGFAAAGRDEMGSLGLAIVKVAVPRGLSLAEGEALLRRAAPEADIAPDSLYFQSGTPPTALLQAGGAMAMPAIVAPVGVIDGAPGAGQPVAALRGFARGAPAASHHGSAIASLLAGAGVRDIRVADVFGTDPAGGNALALVRGLDWLVGGGARVVSISLGGPSNRAVGRAIAAAQARGVVVVAAVGNDGPAAPPAYPASYPGVLAVTGVDARGRALIEAGRATHLDYAAPGADIAARNRNGRWSRVRGTSYAVPLVAARAAAALQRGGPWRAALDSEAEDLGPRGADPQYGRGLLCRGCARRP